MNEALFIFSYSTLYSLLEIELEAKEGWCKNLPTPVVLGKFTLYHVLMNIIVIITLLKVYVKNKDDLAKGIFYIALWFLVEDFMWFVMNPYYKIEKYKKEYIWWHARSEWYYGIPEHNYIGGLVIIICWLLSKEKLKMCCNLLYILIFVLLGIMYSEYYHKYYISIHKFE